MSPEDIKRLPPEVQQFFSERSAGYVATADIASGKIEVAKATVQTRREVIDPENGLIGNNPADAVLEQQEVSVQESLAINTSIGGQEVLFGSVQRQDVEQWIKQRDSRQKLIAIDESLRSFRYICKEISHLRGWAELTKVINGLPASELADEVRWNKKKQWLDNQFAIIKNKDGDTSALESDERLQGFYLELYDLLVASQALLLELRQGTGDESREQDDHRKHIPFKKRLTATRQLIEEWKDLVRQSGMKDEELHAAVAERLGKKAEDVLDIRAFARELRELGERHHWEGDTAKGDKSHVRIEMKHLEEMMPHVCAIVAEKNLKRVSGRKLRDMPAIRLEDNAYGITTSPGETRRELQIIERNEKRLNDLQIIVEKFKETYNQFQLVEDRATHRRSYERYGQGEKAEAGKIILPSLYETPGVVTDHRELLKQGIHDIYGEFIVATDVRILQGRASGKGMEGIRQFDAYKNYLENLYQRLLAQIEVIQKRSTSQSVREQTEPAVSNEREKIIQEIERTLVEKLKVFVERMNERLLQQEPGISYAKRRGRILAQMPEFSELVLNLPQYQSITLSSAERNAMIENNTASIQISK